MRALAGAVLAIALCAGAALAGNSEDQADALFREAKALEKTGKQAEACAKYRAALDANPNAIGTILNVARCDQEAGKFASAYKRFKDARDRAREQNLPDQLQAADDHLTQLEYLVSHVALAFAEGATDDTKIVVDDEVVDRDKAGDVLVDPGVVAIVVSRPGRVTYETRLDIDKGAHEAIAIPRLAMPVTVKHSRVMIGKIMVAGGAALAIAGVTMGIYAKTQYDAQFKTNSGDMNMVPCTRSPNGPACDGYGQANTDSARNLGWAGTFVGAGGIIIAGVGTYLWLFGHRDEKLAFAPHIDERQAGIVAWGRF